MAVSVVVGGVEAAAPGVAPTRTPMPRKRPRHRWHTTPTGRLGAAALALAVLVVVFGALTAWQVAQRAAAAKDVVQHSQPLSNDAAELFRSLADADTTAATGFLQAGDETAAVRARYDQDIATASELLTKAAAQTATGDPGQHWITAIDAQLPVYTQLVSTAQADNRLGYPLGGAYLSYASATMQSTDAKQSDSTMLGEAQKLYDAETAQLHRDYAHAKAFPWAAVVLGVLTLVALVWAQLRLFNRTNRVFNVGLATASLLAVAALVWTTAGQTLAAGHLSDGNRRGSAPLQLLDEARITALQCRGAENLNLVARGSTTDYETSWTALSAQLRAALPRAAAATSGDPTAQRAVRSAEAELASWQKLHDAAQAENDKGDYDQAVAATIGTTTQPQTPATSGSSGTGAPSGAGGTGGTGGAGAGGVAPVGTTISAAFNALDADLTTAVQHEEHNFTTLAGAGRHATSGLVEGAPALAVLAALAAVLGINRRAAEYR